MNRIMLNPKTALPTLAFAVLATGCTIKEEHFFQDEPQIILTASIEGNGTMKGISAASTETPEESGLTSSAEGLPDTRTTVQDSGAQVFWEPADEIKVFFKGEGSKFVSKNAGNAATADFAGSMNILVGANEGEFSQNKVWGLYPFREDATSDGNSVTTTLPYMQTGRAGSFAKDTHVMLSCSGGLDLAFYNVCGGLRFSLTQPGIKSVVLSGNNNENLCGKINLAFENGVPVISGVSDGIGKIRLSAQEGGTFDTGKWYYIEALPCDLTKGFTLIFNKEKEYATLESSTPVSIRRGVFGALAEADKGLTFKDRYPVAEAVDLGLSVKWASFNVGASAPEDYGDYFAWGETEPKSTYDWSTYKWCNGSSNNLTKYNTSSSYGDVDNKTVLDPEDDAATVNMGGSWRMPTDAEWTELRDNCTWTWTNDYNGTGVKGQIVTSNKPGFTDKSIFLPAGDNKGPWGYPTSFTDGNYWSASIYLDNSSHVWRVHFNSYAVYRDNGHLRCEGNSVRAVEGNSLDSIIQFADPSAKYACVEKFDTDGDGEISYTEAAAVTSLSGLFSEWNTVSTFDEIKYFTGVASTEGVFSGLDKLERITIPDHITQLGTFKNCSSLKSVVLPNSVSKLPASCFEGCSDLTDVTLPGSANSIPDYCFKNCVSLPGVDLPGNITAIGREAFQGCSAITSISLPNVCKTMGDAAFSSCSGLRIISLPSELSAIPSNCFNKCMLLSEITWPSNLTNIGSYAFCDCFFEDTDRKLELPCNVTHIGSFAFTGLHHLIVPSSTMVSIDKLAFGSRHYTLLYVLGEKVSAYKLKTNWSEYEDRILSIETFPSDFVPGTVAEAVDLGLSVKWASWNLGAISPEEYGHYYAWGETEPKYEYSWSTYKLCNGSNISLTKYNSSPSYGNVDGETRLEPVDDAANVNWGNAWRMATKEEWNELINNCTWVWEKQNGVLGCKVTSKIDGYNDKSIFLPGSGNGVYYSTDYDYGVYWSSDSDWNAPGTGEYVQIGAFDPFWYWNERDRRNGKSIRPVKE
ncbi:MAG: leucine-rich repeat protein [Bacteroidales bacterium]|nr:leucine-rich repeat protein [Bacteroidales bacterium]